MSSRSTQLRLRVLLAASALVAGVTVTAGCSTQATSAFADGEPTSPLNDQGGGTNAPSLAAADAGATKPMVYRGNPLCQWTGNECMPDDDGYRLTAGAQPCAEPPPDAGDAALDATPGHGCRLAPGPAGSAIAPVCADVSTPGGDGASCTRGEDCAAGFDCIAGDKTMACRRYCCSGTCKGQLSQSGGATFCDVQDLAEFTQKAPVCMPLKRCMLLGTGECSADESCAVVTESGDTGCVRIGAQQVGASCDEGHCAAKLTCLGQPGSRKCYKLCKVSSSECGSSQVCATSTVFKDPNFGICQKP